jgi:iron complex transport system ATP-binding protein
VGSTRREPLDFPGLTISTMPLLASLRDVTVVRDDRTLLSVEALEIEAGSRWVLLGPNGSGKSTLLSIMAGRLWPTSGAVELLGHRLGRVDLRTLRARLGLMSSSLGKQLRASLSAHDVVVTGIDGALEPWWRQYEQADHNRAAQLLEELGVGDLGPRAFGVLSDGERAHVLLARVLMAEPELLCLDEPAAGLDLGARERLLARLRAVVAARRPGALVLVTHHLEEIPIGMTHAALLKEGQIVARGPIGSVLSSQAISETFEAAIEVTTHRDGRLSARGGG